MPTAEQMFGNKKLKRKLVESVKAVKAKVKALHDENTALTETMEKTFKPLTNPLNTLLKNNELPTFKQKPQFLPLKKGEKFKKEVKWDQEEEKEETLDDAAAAAETSVAGLAENNFSTPNSSFLDDDDDDDDDDDKLSVEYANETLSSPLEKKNIINEYLKSEHRYTKPELYIVYFLNGEPHIGNSKVIFTDDHNLQIGNKVFETTRGLVDLLFNKSMSGDFYTKKDVNTYKDIVEMTNANRQEFDENKQRRGDRSKKYTLIWKQEGNWMDNVVNTTTTTTTPKPGATTTTTAAPMRMGDKKYEGKGINLTLKRYRPKTDYVYWDDANELVDRLRLLYASQMAGNTGHENEINSIIEELIEAGIIVP
ncbi:hypothetical protein O0L34_g12962 [Tuta absoluta]|nr:hypothetical protein O0L34_g12962 [Tuta absoluta]